MAQTFTPNELASIPEQAGNLLIGLAAKITQIEADALLSREGKNAKIDQLVSAAIAELDRLEQAAQSEVEAVQRKAHKILDGQPGDTQEQILTELKAQRLWARIRRKLDAYTEQASLLRGLEAEIEQAGREGDRLTLQVLREELPDYLAARRLTMPQVFDWLDQAEVPLLTPEQREARKALIELEQNLPRVLAALDTARRAMEKRAFKVPALPGWGGETVFLNW
jgi:hypothetical protein